jgi:hypothetical protein
MRKKKEKKIWLVRERSNKKKTMSFIDFMRGALLTFYFLSEVPDKYNTKR